MPIVSVEHCVDVPTIYSFYDLSMVFYDRNQVLLMIVRARLREVRESTSKRFETRKRPSKNFRDDLAEGIQSYV